MVIVISNITMMHLVRWTVGHWCMQSSHRSHYYPSTLQWDPLKHYIGTRIPFGPQHLVGGPSGLLDFVLQARLIGYCNQKKLRFSQIETAPKFRLFCHQRNSDSYFRFQNIWKKIWNLCICFQKTFRIFSLETAPKIRPFRHQQIPGSSFRSDPDSCDE